MEARTQAGRPGAGWALFVGVMFVIVGLFNVFDGIVALAGDDHFSEELFFFDLSTWGVILLIVGGLQLFASMQLFSGRGQMLGILLLIVNLMAQLFFLPAFPVWSVIIMVICVMAIYGLTVNAESFE